MYLDIYYVEIYSKKISKKVKRLTFFLKDVE
jgi:hypothetical protein